MRILLSDMPVSSENKFGKLKKLGSSSPPYNILLLGTILKKAGHDVRLTTDTSSLGDVESVIKDFRPEVIGVTFMTLGSCFLGQFAKMVKRVAPDSLFIAGGYHSSLYPEETLDRAPAMTAVFIGEAEISLPKFIEVAEQGKPDSSALREVPGICFQDEGGELVRTAPPTPIKNLDDLPFPDFTLIPGYFDNYFGSVNRHYLGSPQAFLLTSRGCPYNCHFCGRKILGRKVRSHSPEYILDLLQHCRDKYSIKSIIYGDEFFTLNRKQTYGFCDELKRRGLDRIKWSCSGRVNNMDYEYAKILREAGCRQIVYGTESGSQTILDKINKRATVEQNANAVLCAHRAGLQAYGSFILGSPGETPETLQETRDFILEYPLAFVGLLFFTPLPGSHFFEGKKYAEYGTVVNEDFSIYNCFDGLPFVPHGMTEDYLRSFRAKLYRDFYLRPSRILREMQFALNPNSWSYFLRMISLKG